MADFYSIMAQAVSGLDSNTRDARRMLYERARSALDGQGTAALGQSDFLIARISLEEAIAKVEAEAQRGDIHRRKIAPRSTLASRGGTASGPVRPVPEPSAQSRSLWIRFWTKAFRRERDGNSDNLSGEMASESSRDTWLSDLLARASRDDEDDNNQTFEPQRTFVRSDFTARMRDGDSVPELFRLKYKSPPL
jgi:hypothetical protein